MKSKLKHNTQKNSELKPIFTSKCNLQLLTNCLDSVISFNRHFKMTTFKPKKIEQYPYYQGYTTYLSVANIAKKTHKKNTPHEKLNKGSFLKKEHSKPLDAQY
jgi:hypothetical protein